MIKTFLSFFVSFLLTQGPAFASLSDWENVKALKKGKTIDILLNSGQWLSADFVRVEGEKLLVENGSDRFQVVSRNEISEIQIRTKSIGKSVLIGTVIAAGAGFVCGLIAKSGSTEDEPILPIAGAIFAAPIGASAGLMHGLIKENSKRVYRSEHTREDDKEELTVMPITDLNKRYWSSCLFCEVDSRIFEAEHK